MAPALNPFHPDSEVYGQKRRVHLFLGVSGPEPAATDAISGPPLPPSEVRPSLPSPQGTLITTMPPVLLSSNPPL